MKFRIVLMHQDLITINAQPLECIKKILNQINKVKTHFHHFETFLTIKYEIVIEFDFMFDILTLFFDKSRILKIFHFHFPIK